MQWREQSGVRWLEARLPGARAVFTTRLGGVSEGAFESLNLGLNTDDDPELVERNRDRAASALGRDPTGLLSGRQVHGTELARAERPRDADLPPPQADGQLTAEPALTAMVTVADCLPIALRGERGVAMVHGGWRGLAAGILARGTAEVGATAAAIGPGIGRCCYEVGDEVLGAFAELGPQVADGRMLDLVAVARAQLERAGVAEVAAAELCTSCEPELFYSHRRDGGRTGRQAGCAWIEAG